MNISSLFVVIDTRHNQLSNVVIEGFSIPLHESPAFGTIFPKYSVSLDDCFIYDLLQAYIHPQGFDMKLLFKKIQLKTLTIVHFGNDNMPPLQPHIRHTSQLVSEVESGSSKSTTLVTFEWTVILKFGKLYMTSTTIQPY